jgi:hypothetical protein
MGLKPVKHLRLPRVHQIARNSSLVSASSPDVKMTAQGVFVEKSCNQTIDILLIDLTSRAPAAISATNSLDVSPVSFNAVRDLVTPATLISVVDRR